MISTTAQRAIGISLIWLLTITPPIIISATSPIKKSDAWKSKKPAFAPPAVVFPVVWSLLYVAAATALMLQIFWASDDANSAVKWTAVALVSAQLVVGFAWPVVWNANQLRAATFMILGMLALLAPGIVLTSRVNTVSAALWSVMAVWLVFALLLSASSVDKQVSTQ